MKIFIVADIEGCTGVVHPEQLMQGQPYFEQARKLMTADVNAAIVGALREAPQAEFLVGDGHATMRNVILEELHPSAELVIGSSSRDNKPLCQCEGAQLGHDLAFLVGFHSKSGTRAGLLSHTLAGAHVYRFLINGVEVGESAIAEAIGGSFGMPVGLVVGNHELHEECADTLLPGFEFVATKRTLGPTAAICRTPARTAADIADAAARAVRNCLQGKLSPRGHGAKVEMVVEAYRREFVDRALAAEGTTRVGDTGFSASAANAADCFRIIWRALCYGMDEPPAWLR